MNVAAAPAAADEAVAVVTPGSGWNLKCPGRGWAQVPAAQGGAVLAALVRAPGATRWTLWRVVQTAGSDGQVQIGVTKLAAGAPGQPISGRLAETHSRMGVLHNVVPGTVAPVGKPGAPEAPIHASVGAPATSPALGDAEPVTEEDAPAPATTLALPPGPTAVAPSEPPPEGIAGLLQNPIVRLAVLVGGGYYVYKRWIKPRTNGEEGEEGEAPAARPNRRLRPKARRVRRTTTEEVEE